MNGTGRELSVVEAKEMFNVIEANSPPANEDGRQGFESSPVADRM